jgi:hypothetical protein
VGAQDRHPTASFSAPKADGVTVYIATKPDQATDGSFLSENVATLDVLTDSEIQAGTWKDESQLDPGTYYVMLRASPNFDACWIFDQSRYDDSCANGYSSVVPLTIPRPTTRYVGGAAYEKFLRRVTLRLTAAPLGEKIPYKVCYALKSKAKRCLGGTLSGYDWNSGANDELSASARGLAKRTTFTWYVRGARVARRTIVTV